MTQVFEPLDFKNPQNNRGLPMMALHGTLAMWGSSDVRRFLLLFLVLVPRHSMYGIFTNIWPLLITVYSWNPKRPLFLKVNAPKQGPNSNQNKGHLGSRLLCVRSCFSLFAIIVLSGCLFASCLWWWCSCPWLCHWEWWNCAIYLTRWVVLADR